MSDRDSYDRYSSSISRPLSPPVPSYEPLPSTSTASSSKVSLKRESWRPNQTTQSNNVGAGQAQAQPRVIGRDSRSPPPRRDRDRDGSPASSRGYDSHRDRDRNWRDRDRDRDRQRNNDIRDGDREGRNNVNVNVSVNQAEDRTWAAWNKKVDSVAGTGNTSNTLDDRRASQHRQRSPSPPYRNRTNDRNRDRDRDRRRTPPPVTVTGNRNGHDRNGQLNQNQRERERDRNGGRNQDHGGNGNGQNNERSWSAWKAKVDQTERRDDRDRDRDRDRRRSNDRDRDGRWTTGTNGNGNDKGKDREPYRPPPPPTTVSPSTRRVGSPYRKRDQHGRDERDRGRDRDRDRRRPSPDYEMGGGSQSDKERASERRNVDDEVGRGRGRNAQTSDLRGRRPSPTTSRIPPPSSSRSTSLSSSASSRAPSTYGTDRERKRPLPSPVNSATNTNTKRQRDFSPARSRSRSNSTSSQARRRSPQPRERERSPIPPPRVRRQPSPASSSLAKRPSLAPQSQVFQAGPTQGQQHASNRNDGRSQPQLQSSWRKGEDQSRHHSNGTGINAVSESRQQQHPMHTNGYNGNNNNHDRWHSTSNSTPQSNASYRPIDPPSQPTSSDLYNRNQPQPIHSQAPMSSLYPTSSDSRIKISFDGTTSPQKGLRKSISPQKPALQHFFEDPAGPSSSTQPSAPRVSPVKQMETPDVFLDLDRIAANEESYSAFLKTVAPYIQAAFDQWSAQNTTPALPAFLHHYFGRPASNHELNRIETLFSLRRQLTKDQEELIRFTERVGRTNINQEHKDPNARTTKIPPSEPSAQRRNSSSVNGFPPTQQQQQSHSQPMRRRNSKKSRSSSPTKQRSSSNTIPIPHGVSSRWTSTSNTTVPLPPDTPRGPSADSRNGKETSSTPSILRQPSSPKPPPTEFTPPKIERAPERAASVPTAPFNTSGEMYEKVAHVGEGTYGKVYKARNNDTGALVALKRIRMEGEKDGFPITSMREIKLLQALKHENVIKLHEMMVSQGSVYMVFEYMELDLTGLLAHPSLSLSSGNIKSLNHQMLSGLSHLHERSILHRDMKGSNILLNSKGELKLADFGLARVYSKRHRDDYTNRVITLWYRSPELLLGETVYGPEVDMWSAGCIMLELFTTKPVFQGQDEIHQLEVIYSMMGTPTSLAWPEMTELPWYELVKPKEVIESKFRLAFAKWLSPAALDLAEGLLSHDPSIRLSANAALETAYFLTEDPPMEKPTQLAGIGEHHEMSAKRDRRQRQLEGK